MYSIEYYLVPDLSVEQEGPVFPNFLWKIWRITTLQNSQAGHPSSFFCLMASSIYNWNQNVYPITVVCLYLPYGLCRIIIQNMMSLSLTSVQEISSFREREAVFIPGDWTIKVPFGPVVLLFSEYLDVSKSYALFYADLRAVAWKCKTINVYKELLNGNKRCYKAVILNGDLKTFRDAQKLSSGLILVG